MTFGLVKHNNNSISAVTSVGLTQGKMTLLQTQTASSSSSIDFTSNIDSTYPIYISNYNQTLTTSTFTAYHNEAGDSVSLAYNDVDHAQGSGFQHLGISVGNDNDQSVSGTLTIFEPSSSVFVKHFLARSSTYTANDHAYDLYVGGYFNTTTPITRFRFKYDSDTIDSGTIKLYGIKGS